MSTYDAHDFKPSELDMLARYLKWNDIFTVEQGNERIDYRYRDTVNSMLEVAVTRESSNLKAYFSDLVHCAMFILSRRYGEEIYVVFKESGCGVDYAPRTWLNIKEPTDYVSMYKFTVGKRGWTQVYPVSRAHVQE